MKTLMIATIVSLTTGLVVTQPAFADYDSVGAALFGGVAGAVIGSAVGGRQGAAVGAAIGGFSGAIASTQQRQYHERQEVYTRAPARTTYYAAAVPVTYHRETYPSNYYPTSHYSTTYYPAHEEVYPVRQVTYYVNEYRGYHHDRRYSHDRGWRRDRHERYDRYDRGYSRY